MLFQNKKKHTSLIRCKRSRITLLEFLCNKLLLHPEMINIHCSNLFQSSGKPALQESDKRLKNTFGWARIDIITMLVCCVFVASFCFSLLIEALQTLVHIDHLDEMHHPLPVLCIGACGILLNLLCYILIGGFTFNQGVFLHVTNSGDVILCR